MKLLEVFNTINAMAAEQPNINTIVTSGNVFDLNTDNTQVRYGAFCCQQEPHTQNGDFIDFNFTLFVVDRLTEDKKNKVEVQSTAIFTLQNIIRGLQNLDVIDTSDANITYTTFTERFAAECAGAYCNISISSTVDVCYDEIIGILGDFSADFSNDFLVRIK